MSKKFVFFVFSALLLGIAVLFGGASVPTSAHASPARQVHVNVDSAPAAALACPTTLRRGSQGSLVSTLQRTLNSVYANTNDPRFFFNSPNDFGPFTQDPNNPLRVDGDFGGHTFNAVVDYQHWNFLAEDGVVGPNTWHSLGFC